MATNSISGRIVEKDTALGIADVLAIVFDVDPNTKPEEEFGGTAGAAPPIPTQLAMLGDRLGSVLTGPDGSFQLDFDDADYRVRNPDEQRPDLMLLVTAPEDAKADAVPDFILAATPIRQGAGRIEQYLVRLTGEQLTAA